MQPFLSGRTFLLVLHCEHVTRGAPDRAGEAVAVHWVQSAIPPLSLSLHKTHLFPLVESFFTNSVLGAQLSAHVPSALRYLGDAHFVQVAFWLLLLEPLVAGAVHSVQLAIPTLLSAPVVSLQAIHDSFVLSSTVTGFLK